MPELGKEVEIVLAGRQGYVPRLIRKPLSRSFRMQMYPSYREVMEFNQAVGIQLPKGAIFLGLNPIAPTQVHLWFAGEKDAVEETRYFIVSTNDTVVDPTPYSLKHLLSMDLQNMDIFHVWERVK